MNAQRLSQRRSRSRGFSLIEILVSMVIGLVVIGAVLISYVSSGQTGKLQSAYSQMAEEAQIGMFYMRNDLMLAGYARPTKVNTASSTLARIWAGRPIYGCEKGFTFPTATNVACSTTGTIPAFEVVYEADKSNTIPTSAGIPTDCIGNAVASIGTGTSTYYLASNRYYIAQGATGRPELHCASPGSTGQPLADNTEGLKIWYGVASVADARQPVRYVTAADVAAGDWTDRVVSVRICLLMRSGDPVVQADETFSYLDCDLTSRTVTDRYVRRAFFSTVTLRNRMAL